MPALAAAELKWFETLTGTGAQTDKGLEKEADEYESVQKEKEKVLAEVNAKLDLLRDAIREGQTYVLKQKGLFKDKEIKSIEQDNEKLLDEVETMEDIAKSELLPPEMQRKILAAQADVVKLSEKLSQAKKPNSDEPLFGSPTLKSEEEKKKIEAEKKKLLDKIKLEKDKKAKLADLIHHSKAAVLKNPSSPEAGKFAGMKKDMEVIDKELDKLEKELKELVPEYENPDGDLEIMDELWTPLMREKVMSDNAIPAKYSKVQKAFENSSTLYMEKLKEIEYSSKDTAAGLLDSSKDFVKAAGDVATAIEALIPGAPKIAGTITKGIQIGLASGMGVASGVLKKSSEDIVTNSSSIIKMVITDAVGAAMGPEMGKMIGTMAASGFTAACKVPQMAEALAKKPEPDVGRVLSILGQAIEAGMATADPSNNSTDGPLALMGRSIAASLEAQESITRMVQEAIKNKEKPNTATLLKAFNGALLNACGSVVAIKAEFVNQAKEEEKKKAEEEKTKQEAEKQKIEKDAESLKGEKEKLEKEREKLERELAAVEGPKAKAEASEHASAQSEEGNKKEEEKKKQEIEAKLHELKEQSESLEKELSAKEAEAKEKDEEIEKHEKEVKKLEKEIEGLEKSAEGTRESLNQPGEKLGEEAEESEKKKKEEAKSEKAKKEVEAKRAAAKKQLEELGKTLKNDPQALDKIKHSVEDKLKKLEKEETVKELAKGSAEFQAMLQDIVPPGVDGDERAAAEADSDAQSIENLIKRMEADKQIIETLNMLVDSGLQITASFVPPVGVAVHLKDFITNCIAAVERAIQLNEWLDHLADSQNSMSPYARAMQNRVTNSKIQLSQKTIQAALNFAEFAGAVTACSGIASGAGVVVEKSATAARAGLDLAYKVATEAEMARQWSLFKKAFENPANRRAGKKALEGNPTLSKYAIAYGALHDNDDNARKAMNKCGLTDQVLANKDTSVQKVVTYLETMFADDPQLYRAAPKELHGIKPEFTLSNWRQVREKVGKHLAPDSKLDAISGALAKVAIAEKQFHKQKSDKKLAKSDLDNCESAITAVVALLGKYVPKEEKDPNKTNAEMKQYVDDLIDLAKVREGDLNIEFGSYESKKPALVGAK